MLISTAANGQTTLAYEVDQNCVSKKNKWIKNQPHVQK